MTSQEAREQTQKVLLSNNKEILAEVLSLIKEAVELGYYDITYDLPLSDFIRDYLKEQGYNIEDRITLTTSLKTIKISWK